MTKRSLKASLIGINRANKAVLNFATKIDLAAELEISRATVQNFFAGKAVGRENFHKICQKLKLPWQEVADLPEELQPQLEAQNGDGDFLVQLRNKASASIRLRCGIMRVLDMSQPIGLNEIYTNVNILEKISGRRRLEVVDLLKVCVSDEFERPHLGRISQERVPGLEAVKQYSKLMLLGKPGAGKTTFLKYLAIQCILGEFQANQVPIFITLKDFAETEQRPSLLEYIYGEFYGYGFTDAAVTEKILSEGKAFVLLDGLDEVRETDASRVLQEVHNFVAKFHSNHFVITCRIATREYMFEQFTEVEVADFDDEQIHTFATKWFAVKDPSKSNKFIQKILASSPIRELATNPLLLTLLCLMFEESADFPSNRAELYKEGLNVLLRKWDAKRNIFREQIYKKLSIQHKEDLLSQIALTTFERGDYFFRQKEIEHYITDYICNLPSANIELEALQLDSEAVLKSIEAQHGLLVERARSIYSFSHLTFHEYFTAREIVSSSDPQALDKALRQLISRITDKRWHEVFLLSVSMLRNADYMLQLMKQKIDDLLAQDQQLQVFLTLVSQKSRAVPTPYKLVTVRAFYLDLELARALDLIGGSLDLARNLDFDLARTLALDFDLALDRALARALALIGALKLAFNRVRVLDRVLALARVLTAVLALALARAHAVDFELEESLQHLKEQLSNSADDGTTFNIWWKANGGAWTEELRAVMISYRHIGHDWQFSVQQKEALKQYYDANQLLVDCLNNARYVTRTVRQGIEETLLLPIAELKIS